MYNSQETGKIDKGAKKTDYYRRKSENRKKA